jgi:hypothetical protein
MGEWAASGRGRDITIIIWKVEGLHEMLASGTIVEQHYRRAAFMMRTIVLPLLPLFCPTLKYDDDLSGCGIHEDFWKYLGF